MSWRVGLCALAVALACGRTDEPRAGGAPLSHWQREARLVSFLSFWNSEKDERRHEAFRRLVEIGEPAVPVLTDLLLEETIPVSGDALKALCALGPRAASAVPELSRAVASGSHDAVWALGCIGTAASAAVPALAELTKGPDPVQREVAMQALGRIGGAGREVLERAAHDSDAQVRAGAIAGLAPGGAGAPHEREYLAAALGDPAPEVRARAFSLAHPRTRDDAAAMADLVVRGMGDESEAVREAARRWYGSVCQNQRDSAALHERILAEGDPGSRGEAAWRLGSQNLEHWHFSRAALSPEVSRALAGALRDGDAVVRIYAARGLSRDPGAPASLAAALREAVAAPDVDVRARVIGARQLFSLSQDPRDVEAAYLAGLRAPDGWIQLESLAAIRDMGRAGAGLQPEVERLRRDSADPKAREHAGWLLTQLADRSR